MCNVPPRLVFDTWSPAGDGVWEDMEQCEHGLWLTDTGLRSLLIGAHVFDQPVLNVGRAITCVM